MVSGIQQCNRNRILQSDLISAHRQMFFHHDGLGSPGHHSRVCILRHILHPGLRCINGTGIVPRILVFAFQGLLLQGREGNLQLPPRLCQLPVEGLIPHRGKVPALFFQLGDAFLKEWSLAFLHPHLRPLVTGGKGTYGKNGQGQEKEGFHEKNADAAHSTPFCPPSIQQNKRIIVDFIPAPTVPANQPGP